MIGAGLVLVWQRAWGCVDGDGGVLVDGACSLWSDQQRPGV